MAEGTSLSSRCPSLPLLADRQPHVCAASTVMMSLSPMTCQGTKS